MRLDTIFVELTCPATVPDEEKEMLTAAFRASLIPALKRARDEFVLLGAWDVLGREGSRQVDVRISE